MLIINTTSSKAEPKVNTPTGPDFIHIQPKGRVTLPEGYTLDSNWMALNGHGLKVIGSAPVATAVAAAPSYTRKASEKPSVTSTDDKE